MYGKVGRINSFSGIDLSPRTIGCEQPKSAELKIAEVDTIFLACVSIQQQKHGNWEIGGNKEARVKVTTENRRRSGFQVR